MLLPHGVEFCSTADARQARCSPARAAAQGMRQRQRARRIRFTRTRRYACSRHQWPTIGPQRRTGVVGSRSKRPEPCPSPCLPPAAGGGCGEAAARRAVLKRLPFQRSNAQEGESTARKEPAAVRPTASSQHETRWRRAAPAASVSQPKSRRTGRSASAARRDIRQRSGKNEGSARARHKHVAYV